MVIQPFFKEVATWEELLDMARRTGAAPGVREPTARPRPKTAAMPTAFISVVSDENHLPANCLEEAATLGFSTFSFSTSAFPSSQSFFSFVTTSFSMMSMLASIDAGIILTASNAAVALSLHSSSFSAQSRLVITHTASCSSLGDSELSFFSPNNALTLLSSAKISSSAAAAAIRAASTVSIVD